VGSHKDGLNDQQMGIGDEPLNEQGHADKKDLKEGKALRGELLHGVVCGEEATNRTMTIDRGQVSEATFNSCNYSMSIFYLGSYEFLL